MYIIAEGGEEKNRDYISRMRRAYPGLETRDGMFTTAEFSEFKEGLSHRLLIMDDVMEDVST